MHGELRPDVAIKDDWILKAYGEFPVDVINVSSHDLRYFSRLFKPKPSLQHSSTDPVFDRLVSANIVSDSAGVRAPHPFVIRDLSLERTNGRAKKLRVAFIGLTESEPVPPQGLKFTDAIEAARRTMPEARKNADLVIALAKVSTEQAARIAREVPGIDVIIAGNAVTLEQSFTPPLYVGKTLIAFTPFETKMLGELRFYLNAQGAFSTKQRFIALDEVLVPSDPAAKKLVDAATAAENDARSQSKKLLDQWLAISRAPSGSRATSPASAVDYVGSNACSQCHVGQYMKWANSSHARASDPLVPRAFEFEMSCLACHATGRQARSESNEFAGMQSVQCEQCHGPGGAHAAKPAKGYGRVANITTACASCHTSETSPSFDVQAAWSKIKH
ncbi:MAG TPA: multiheme c-type cytochrome [Blastocatellia bacterium]|nr:multiheme c-type cytochrome [Blastocatellia bacterium]